MIEGKGVAVVVPAHDEERLIATTPTGIPGFVDRVLVVTTAPPTARAGGSVRRG